MKPKPTAPEKALALARLKLEVSTIRMKLLNGRIDEEVRTAGRNLNRENKMKRTLLTLAFVVALTFTVGCQSEADRKADAVQAAAVAKWNATPHPVTEPKHEHVITDICEPGAVAIQQACEERNLTTPQCMELNMSAQLHERANGTLSCGKPKR